MRELFDLGDSFVKLKAHERRLRSNLTVVTK